MLTDEQVTQFQTLYKKHFGKEISKAEALESGIKLVRLMEIVCNPKPQDVKADKGEQCK